MTLLVCRKCCKEISAYAIYFTITNIGPTKANLTSLTACEHVWAHHILFLYLSNLVHDACICTYVCMYVYIGKCWLGTKNIATGAVCPQGPHSAGAPPYEAEACLSEYPRRPGFWTAFVWPHRPSRQTAGVTNGTVINNNYERTD